MIMQKIFSYKHSEQKVKGVCATCWHYKLILTEATSAGDQVLLLVYYHFICLLIAPFSTHACEEEHNIRLIMKDTKVHRNQLNKQTVVKIAFITHSKTFWLPEKCLLSARKKSYQKCVEEEEKKTSFLWFPHRNKHFFFLFSINVW